MLISSCAIRRSGTGTHEKSEAENFRRRRKIAERYSPARSTWRGVGSGEPLNALSRGSEMEGRRLRRSLT